MIYNKKIDFVNINYYITNMMNTDKKGQNNQETEKTEQSSQGDQFRQPSIYSRHDDVCFLDQADHQNSDN